MKIDRSELVEAMKDSEELERLVEEFGGVDRTVVITNAILPIMEKVIKVVSDFVESFETYLEELEMEKEHKTFEDCLDNCDADIQIKFNYLDELLCGLDDEISEVFEDIQKAEVDMEIATKLLDRKRYNEANLARTDLKNYLGKLEDEYSVVDDLYEDMMLNILM